VKAIQRWPERGHFRAECIQSVFVLVIMDSHKGKGSLCLAWIRGLE